MFGAGPKIASPPICSSRRVAYLPRHNIFVPNRLPKQATLGYREEKTMEYDAIIAGGSFAGLAVAREIKGNVLLIDQHQIGARQTSGCATLVDVLEKLDCQDSILQSFDSIRIHVAGNQMDFDFGYPFCTFDYEIFCDIMRKSINAEIVETKVKTVEGDTLVTDKGKFEGRTIVDATGWKAVLANSLRPGTVNHNKHGWFKNNKNGTPPSHPRPASSRKSLSFGCETILPLPKDQLEFHWNPHNLRRGITWVFPADKETRFGVGSYVGETKLVGKLERFLENFELVHDRLHGGYFPHRLGEPVVGHIFVLGDAAGQCLPLTGEGIRPALYFGQRCGRIIQRIVNREISREAGLAEYRRFVLKHRQDYLAFFRVQKIFTNIPDFLVSLILKYDRRDKVFPALAQRYWEIAVLNEGRI